MEWLRRLLPGLCVAGLVLGPASAFATAPRDPLAAALALPVATELVGARDSARFAWVESAAGIRNAWFAERGHAARPLTAFTQDDGQQIYDLALTFDGSHLAYVRGGDPESRDEALPNAAWDPEPPRQQIFVVPTSGSGGPHRVGEGHSPAFSPGGERLAFTRRGEIWLWQRGGEARKLATPGGEIRRLQWSPDGTRLLFVSHRGDYSFVALLDPGRPRVRYLDPGLGFSVEPVFSPDGRKVAFIRHLDAPAGAARDSGPYWSVRIVDLADGAARELWAAPPGAGARYYESRGRDLFWSSDGRIVFPWERSGWLHPHALDSAKGGEPRDLTPGAFEVEMFTLGADGRSIVYAANSGDLDRRHIWTRPLSGGAPRRITRGSGIQTAPVLGGHALAVIATDVARPAFPALAESGLEPFKPLAAASGFVAPEPVLFRAEDGVEVHGQFFRARGKGRKPAMVYVHGGPRRQMLLGFHPSAYYSNAYAFNQHLAASGYHVLAVNYRSGTGYGNAFRDAPGIARGGASEYCDVLAAGRWLAGRAEVDPARIGIWGGSWGGYLVALGLARNSELFAAGVDFHGVHSMLRPLPNSLSPDAQAAARQLQWDSSPLGSIDRWRSPVLLIHGDDDRNVDFSQSVLLARELAARRIPYRELVFPNERHSFLLHSNWLASFRAAEAFFDEKLKAPAVKRLLAGLALLLAAAPAQGRDTLIRGARIFDGTGAPARVGNVLVRGDRIVAVGPAVRASRGSRTVDARGLTLIPGLHDLHTHLRAPAFDAPDDLPKAYAAYLANGVTTVNEFSVSPEMLAPIREMTAPGRIAAPNLKLAIRLGVPGGHGTEYGWGRSFTLEAATPRAAHQAMARALPYRPGVIKVFADGWRYGRSPSLNDMNEPTLAAIVEEAHAAGIPVITHTVTLEGAKVAAAAGVDALGHGIGDALVDDALVALMKAKGTAYVPTLVVYEPQEGRAFLPAEWRRLRPQERAREEARKAEPLPESPRWKIMKENVRRLKAAGIAVGIGTDAGIGGVYHGSATLREIGWLTRLGFTPAEALTAATGVSARILRQDEGHGRIAPGQRADLVLTGGRPDHRIEDLHDVRRVFVAGREIPLERLSRELADASPSSLPVHRMTGPIHTGAGPAGRTDLDTLPVEGTDPGMDHSHLDLSPMPGGRLFLTAGMGAAPQPFAELHLPLTKGAVQLADASGFSGIAFEARGTGDYALLLNSYAIHPRSWFRASFEAGESRREIRIAFSAFRSPLPGARLDPARLRALLFRLEGEPGGGAWLELGNVRFYR